MFSDKKEKGGEASIETKLLWILGVTISLIVIPPLFMLPIHHDCAGLLCEANRILDGATLYIDIMEINPPLSVYSLVPAVWLSRLLKCSEASMFITYVLLLIIVSLWFCFKMINIVFQDNIKGERFCIFISLCFISLVWQLTSFGQREHLTFILTMPYILAAMARALDEPLDKWFAFVIGFLAGIGLSFKPHFFLLWIFVEGYLILSRRNKRIWLWIGNLAILLTVAFYNLLLIIFTEYFTMVKLLLKVYQAYDEPFAVMLIDPRLLPWLLSGVVILFIRLSPRYAQISRILFVASTAFFLTALIQKKGWANHLYPGLATSLLLLSIIFIRLIGNSNIFLRYNYKKLPSYIWVLALCMILASGIISVRKYLMYKYSPLPKLIPLAEKYAAGKQVYFLSTHAYPGAIVMLYSKAKHSYRFGSLWPLPEHYRSVSGNYVIYHKPDNMDRIERMLFVTVIADLVANPPELLIVDQRRYKIGFGSIDFDFIEYFSQDMEFLKFMQKYSVLTKIGAYLIYKNNK